MISSILIVQNYFQKFIKQKQTNLNLMLTSYEKLHVYLTAFVKYEYCTNNPTRILVKHIIKNHKIFST